MSDLKMTDDVRSYYEALEGKAAREYKLAQKARAVGIDPETFVEVPFAATIGERVEGLVGPKGSGKTIASLLREKPRELVALEIIKKIINGEFGNLSEEKKAEQSIRTALALITEGVVAAPIEGISSVEIESNPDGSRYLTVNFAGPIRSAGGTAQALAVLFADYTRQLLGLQEYRPTETEVERYVEEINIYHNVVSRLQYKPSDEEVRKIVKNCPVCISGTPTTTVEVNIYKNLERVKTNMVRGGMCLVIGEGIAQKATRLVNYAREFGLNWDWLHSIIKVEKSKPGKQEIKPIEKYLKDVVAGRPVFAYPSKPGGFRLRYGRARNTGLMSKGIHPATMVILDNFPAIGTQLKVERPGKGTALAPCDSIEGPIVRLRDGSVVRVESMEEATKLKNDVEEILFLGDMLISLGDFIKDNHVVLPSPWVEEWWEQELESKGGKCDDPFNVSFEEAVKYSQEYDIPLHPKYVFPYHDLTIDELKQLISWLEKGKLEVGPEKRFLEIILVPHHVEGNTVVIESPYKEALFTTLSIGTSKEIIDRVEAETSMQLVNELSPFEILEKNPVYIGARMGRPEKAKERLMKPAPHILFPVGNHGGPTRSLMKASEKGVISIEITRLRCPRCGKLLLSWKCDECGDRAVVESICSKCGRPTVEKCEVCGGKPIKYEQRAINLKEALDKAIKEVGKPKSELKGVKGTISAMKAFEPLEKGILRCNNDLHVFKDGTVRFDSTNLVVTHFTPREVGTSIEKLKELGYTKDINGEELKHEDQILELFPQDVIPSDKSVKFFLNATKFLDEELEKLYGLKPYFSCKTRDDLIGLLVVGLAPHTSAGVLGRIVGFSKANVCYAHPYFHAACRRDCDGDEDALMLLMDVLINFSKHYLPSSRGGQMDACLVLTTKINPKEVDDQVHLMETVELLPLEFYRKSKELPRPTDFEVELVRDRLGKKNQYRGFKFTHSTSKIDNGVIDSSYKTLSTMEEKAEAQLNLGRRIRAVDEKDEAKRLLDSHFLPDIYGNLRAFGEQKFRCVNCNMKYRRVPLMGKCTNCGGRIILTVAGGSVKKYLEVSQKIAKEYGLSNYVTQRLVLVERNIDSVFVNDNEAQQSLTDFM